MELLIKKLTEDAIVPFKFNPTDSGFDLFANDNYIIEPGCTSIISTGIAIQLPVGHEAQIRPRSGITAKTKLRVQLGTIDESYRGEIGIIIDNILNVNTVLNEDGELNINKGVYARNIKNELVVLQEEVNGGSYIIKKGDKIAQLIVAPVSHPDVLIVDELDDTDRGDKGFGSTGV